MKNKMISSTILHIVLLIIVCFGLIFSFFKIYDYIIDSSIKEDKPNYITLQTDKYMVECLDYYFDNKILHNELIHRVFYPSTHLVLRLRITNLDDKDIILSNDYKLTYKNRTENLKYGFTENDINIKPGKSVISDIAYVINEYDENIKEYIIDFDGYKMKLIFE